MYTQKYQTLKERRRLKRRKQKAMRILAGSLMTIVVTIAITLSVCTIEKPIMKSKEIETYQIEKVSVPNEIRDSFRTIELNYLEVAENNAPLVGSSNQMEAKVEPAVYQTTTSWYTAEEEIYGDTIGKAEDGKEEYKKDKPSKKKQKEAKGKKMYVPDYVGKSHPYMGWQCITAKSSPQWKLRCEVENYDENGFGKVGEYFAVAVKPFYGEIGDIIRVVQNDGIEYKCIIADHKGMENKSKDGWLAEYVHGDYSLVEFVVDKYSWYGTEKTVYDFYPEFNRNIKEVYNMGSYWDNPRS